MKECAIQIMFFAKSEEQLHQVYTFLEEFNGESLTSIPINTKGKIQNE